MQIMPLENTFKVELVDLSPFQGFGSASISCGSGSRVLKMVADPDPDTDPDTDPDPRPEFLRGKNI